MHQPNKAKKHAALLDRAARHIGVDLQDKAISGALPFDGIADAVLRCMQCASPNDCARWLETPSDVSGQPPEYCRNAGLLAHLRADPA
ncbi:DUF6455 family protein [Shimia sp.]|uniref:DUF6455 family protein n=1 Tax=Shimia sp. TaxID=1954381 RepID=UPI00329890EF